MCQGIVRDDRWSQGLANSGPGGWPLTPPRSQTAPTNRTRTSGGGGGGGFAGSVFAEQSGRWLEFTFDGPPSVDPVDSTSSGTRV